MTMSRQADLAGGKTTVRGYSGLQIGLHWVIAALVLFQLIFGESMEELVDAAREGGTPSASDAVLGNMHYYFGIAILALVIVRLGVRLTRGAPPPAETSPTAIRLAARISHGLFYLMLVVAPIMGLLAYYVGAPFDDMHKSAKPFFIVLIAVHAAAALVHQFWFKDGTLRRMVVPG